MLQRSDVIVVGAGLSGLVAAWRLARAGVQVRVLEARARVGGRTLTRPLGRGVADLGGQWIAPAQVRVLALADELGVARFEQFRDGRAVVVEDQGGSWWSRLRSGLELGRFIRRIERMRARVVLDRPGTGPRAAAWDAMSLGDWLARMRTRRARDSLALLARLHFAAEPGEISFLHALHILQAGSGLVGAGGVGGSEMRLAGGAQSLSLRLAAALAGRVCLGQPVTSIEQTRDGVVVSCADARHAGRYAILAVPPAAIARVAVTPRWPDALAAIHAGTSLGPVIKHALAYERAFWRERGLSGEAYDARGPVSAVVDHTDANGAQPALLAFMLGNQARRLSALDPAARRRIIIEAIVDMLGPEAAAPVAHAEHDWASDPWSTGCVTVMAPGVLGRYHGALRAPVGPIHFAGTETAERWPGYMDGAVEAGTRAAAEVLARLHGDAGPRAGPAALWSRTDDDPPEP